MVGQALDSAERLVVGTRYEHHEIKWATGIAFGENEAITKLIRNRRDDADFSGTAGLPPDNLIASIAFDSNYFKTRSAARVFARSLFSRDLWLFIPGVSQQSLAYDELFSRLFGNFWQHVESSRIGLYSSVDTIRSGQFSLVGVMDARDPAALLKELNDLAHITQLSKESDEDAEALIGKLIADLGDVKYLVREDASLRLSMVGKKAIDQLQVAAKSKDLEVAFRARRLLRPYLDAARANAEKVVKDGAFWNDISPQFQFEETSEKVLEYPCTIVRMSFPNSDEQQKMMYSVFGEQWDRIRIVQVGKQFVVLVGSDIKRLERTIANVANKKDPIGARKQIADRKLIGDQMQVHLSIAQLNNLLFHDDPDVYIKEPGDDLTSLGFSFEQNRWLLNIFVPGSELKVIVDNPRMSLFR